MMLTTAPATLTPRHRSARVLTTAPVLSPHWVAERAMSTPPPLTVPHSPYPCLRPTPHLVSVAGPRVSLLGARPTRVADGVQFGSRTVAFKPASVEAKREKALCGGTPSPPLGQALAPPSRPALLPKSRWSPKGRMGIAGASRFLRSRARRPHLQSPRAPQRRGSEPDRLRVGKARQSQ